MYNRKNYVTHAKFLNQAFNHGLVLHKVPRVNEFNLEAGLKPFIDLNTEPRTNTKNDFEKDFSKLINNPDFGKTMENVRRQRYINS